MPTERYEGSCQCGAVNYSVSADLSSPVTCNCSRCQRLGSVMVFVPAADFELKSGDDMLSVYRFNSETIAHKFCRTCGIESFAEGTSRDGSATIMVNVNCLDGVDPRALTAHHFDGRSV